MKLKANTDIGYFVVTDVTYLPDLDNQVFRVYADQELELCRLLENDGRFRLEYCDNVGDTSVYITKGTIVDLVRYSSEGVTVNVGDFQFYIPHRFSQLGML